MREKRDSQRQTCPSGTFSNIYYVFYHYHILPYSLGSLFFINVYTVVFLFNTVIYVFLLLCLRILIVCLCTFIVPAGTLRLPRLRFFRAFSSVVMQMPGYNPQRRSTARNLPNFYVVLYISFVLCCSVYCVCVNVYCTTATGCQPNCN
jgi:hypothetical protein